MPDKIFIIRHAEKPPASGPPLGINSDGEPHPHSLVVRGWQRAGALVPFFCDSRDAAIATPTSIFAPPSHGTEGDHGRPYETVVAIAERVGITIDTRFTLDGEEALAEAVLALDGVVLIVWEHKRIVAIANALLGDDRIAPQSWPDDRFDVVWIFDRDVPPARFRFSQRPQRLLSGDRSDAIE